MNFEGEKFFSLDEAAKKSIFSRSYLLASAKSGKLKAFKAGEDWFTAEHWLNDFMSAVRGDLKKEIEGHSDNRFVRYLPRQRSLLKTAVFLLFSLLAGWLVFFWRQYKQGRK